MLSTNNDTTEKNKTHMQHRRASSPLPGHRDPVICTGLSRQPPTDRERISIACHFEEYICSRYLSAVDGSVYRRQPSQ